MKSTICALLVVLLLDVSVFASDPSTPQNIAVSIAVEDASHTVVTDLKLNEISLKIDGNPVTPSSVVYAGGEPKDWVLLIDCSSSMKKTPLWRPAIEAAVKQLTSSMRARGDRVAVVSVDTTGYVEQDLTSDERRVNAAVRRLRPGGGTALFDTLAASATYLSTRRSQGRQQLIWVITDGGENQSQITLQQLEERLSATAIPILFSLIGDDPRQVKLAKHLVRNSGGAVFQPANKDQCGEKVAELVSFVTKEYLIAFSLDSDTKGHSVRVATSRAGVTLLDHDRFLAADRPAK